MRHSSYRERDYSFGQQILSLRTESHLTQSGLAELLGVSRQAVVGWEAGTSYPSPQHLKHLIELCLQHDAFHRGQEAEEIRALWKSAHVRVQLDETWLIGLLEKQPNSPIVHYRFHLILRVASNTRSTGMDSPTWS
jgi:transcriptional regulator with XRE-family HTH domain